eukprot:TRINITY_DN2135_c0_g1_i1.p1 TRINITY_DN2135_c0_g1~~TRINITY_DN2135_c0_g1_i1.p1  ORF type:complete len:484 (+),score=80.58 TRINITY_DN2135_c0_g1_i1:56-1507(+)
MKRMSHYVVVAIVFVLHLVYDTCCVRYGAAPSSRTSRPSSSEAERPAKRARVANANEQTAGDVEGRKKDRFGNLLDHRENIIAATQAETIWAVRVLKSAIHPNRQLKQLWEGHWDSSNGTNMDLLWAWIQAIEANGHSSMGIIPFRVNPPMTPEGEERNSKPQSLIGAIHSGHKFKNGKDKDGKKVLGMDYYINNRLRYGEQVQGVLPTGESESLEKRHRDVRALPMFEKRGRFDLDDLPREQQDFALSRRSSMRNFHAGITALEYIPDEAVDFFEVPVNHGGKSYNARTGEMKGYNTSRLMQVLDAPCIAGPSGSIEYMVLSMEDDCCGHCKGGLVPADRLRVREALLGIMTAALIAGGQHSLAECLGVAQAMGYFKHLPHMVLGNYYKGAADFEKYLAEELGIAPSTPGQADIVTVQTADFPLARWEAERRSKVPFAWISQTGKTYSSEANEAMEVDEGGQAKHFGRTSASESELDGIDVD